jgi:hypothetical protein
MSALFCCDARPRISGRLSSSAVRRATGRIACHTLPAAAQRRVGRVREIYLRVKTSLGRRSTSWGVVLPVLCSISRANLSHVRAMSIRVDCTRKVCARSAICRHSAASSRHSFALIIPEPNRLLILTCRHPHVCLKPDALTPISVVCGVFATLSARTAPAVAGSPRRDQAASFAGNGGKKRMATGGSTS